MQVCGQRETRGNMESQVRYWLYNRSSTDLKNYICSALPLPTYQDIRQQMIQFHHRKYTAFNQEINRLQSSPHQFMPNSCNWVPAALLKEETTNHIALCYGGVLIAPEIEQGYVPHVWGNVRSVKIRGERSYTGYSVLYGSHSRQAPAGRAQTSYRPYHQEAYCAPVNLAAPANQMASPPQLQVTHLQVMAHLLEVALVELVAQHTVAVHILKHQLQVGVNPLHQEMILTNQNMIQIQMVQEVRPVDLPAI